MSSLAVEFKDVRKTYRTKSRTVEALKGIDLQIPENQIYGFAGVNGAGKSTAIKILVGLLRPDQGEVRVFSHPGGSNPAKRLIGFLPEVTLYHEFMGALELLRIHADIAGIPKSERDDRCHAALAKVGLADRTKSRLKEFSKGMKQRFGIAQALVGDPKLLVFDELTSGLDPRAQASLLELLVDLKSQGMTVFFSAHHLREIEKICDSVTILHNGKLQCAGPLDSVLEDKETGTRLTLEELFNKVTMPEKEEVKS